jgi:hypothetical protein
VRASRAISRTRYFIITADHTYTQNGVIAKYRIPLTFYAPGFLKAEKNATLASQLDISADTDFDAVGQDKAREHGQIDLG